MKSNLVSFLTISISFIILEFGVCVGYASAGNDLITGYLRVDQGVVANSDDYTTYLLSTQIPSTAYGFTTNWLGITGVDSTTFAQVGLIGWNDGLRWFVFTYSPSGVDCLRGSGYWGQNPNGKYKGCRGSVGDLVSMNNWYKVELVSYGQGFWIARVYDTYSIAHDVAKIWINVSTIYKAYNAVEEGYSTISDPQLEGSFYQYSPQYMIWGSGFADWPQSTLPRSANPPESGGNYSRIIADSVFCPSYFSASVNVFGLERAWYGGNSGDGICDWVLFPPISYSGNYDDSSTSLIDYKYAWTHTGQTPSFHRAYNGTESWTNTLGGSATFTFNGSSISRIYSPCPNRGNLLIYIDGVLQQDTPPDNIYGPPSGRWQVIRTWAVSPLVRITLFRW